MIYKVNPRDVKYWDGKIYHPVLERGLLRTDEAFDYGTFSVEAIMPKGLNTGASFWLSGNGNWPPEIDICEAWSKDDNYYQFFTTEFPWINPSWQTTTNVHYNDNDLIHRNIKSKNIPKCKQKLDPTENWIKYECIWEPEKITFKANGKTTRTVSKKISKMLTENLKTPSHGHMMDAIIDIYVADPHDVPNELYTPFRVRNFEYKPL